MSTAQDNLATGDIATLYLNDKPVGTVTPRGASDSWSWGEFAAGPGFAEFAPIFGMWSLMMHADEPSKRLSREAADELRSAEVAIDSIRAKLHWQQLDRWVRIGQINIDDKLIEWKRG